MNDAFNIAPRNNNAPSKQHGSGVGVGAEQTNSMSSSSQDVICSDSCSRWSDPAKCASPVMPRRAARARSLKIRDNLPPTSSSVMNEDLDVLLEKPVATCSECKENLYCFKEADFLLCSACQVVSIRLEKAATAAAPVVNLKRGQGNSSRRFGVGFTKDEMMKMNGETIHAPSQTSTKKNSGDLAVARAA